MRILSQIRKYKSPVQFTEDIISGVIVALVSIPISMGYAQIAGLPAVYGLYGSLLPILVFGLLTTSPQFVVGVDAMPAVMTGGLIAEMGIIAESKEAMNIVPLVSVLVGIWFVVFYFMKAGRIIKYISTPVMGGFISGVSLTIILMQIPKLFGGTPGTGTVIPVIEHIISELPSFNIMSFCLGFFTIVIILVCKKLIPKIPATVIMLAVSALIQIVFRVDRFGVKLLPEVKRGLPSLMIPDLRVMNGHVSVVVLESLSIALVIMAQTLLASGNYAAKYGDDLDTNAELLAYAGMNFAGGITGCAPVNGSVSRSGIADSLHCRSQIMSVTASATMVVILLLFTPVLRFLPVPILTGIVITALTGVLEIKLFMRLWKVSRGEWIIFMISFISVLLFGTVNGVIIGCVLSFFEVAVRAVNPPRSFIGWIPGHDDFHALERNRNASPIMDAVIYRFSGNLFFANIDTLENDIKSAVKPDTKCVIIDARGIGSVDITAVDRLVQLEKSLKAKGINFYLTEHDGSLNDMLRKLGGDYLVKSGAVRRTITLALRDCGINRPYKLERFFDSENAYHGFIHSSDELLAEMEWAFGDDAPAWLDKLAKEAAEALVSGDEDSENELNLASDDLKYIARVHTKWGTLGRFDEGTFWDYLEMNLEKLKADGKLNEEMLRRFEKRIEKRRLESEHRLKDISPDAIKLLHKKQLKIRELFRMTEPEEYAHIHSIQDEIYENTDIGDPELAAYIKELHDMT